MNNVALIGRLANEPQLKTVGEKDTPVCTFNLAVNREGQDGADFIRITAWSKTAELISTYLTKGSQCAIQGKINAYSYKTDEDETKYVTEVVANRVEFLGGKQENKPPAEFESIDDPDLPF